MSNEAEYAKILLEQLGLPPDRVVFENTSRTTWENAAKTYDLVKPQRGDLWILLTSASHMPRAVLCCHGLSVVSLATRSAPTPSQWGKSLPDWIGRHMSGSV